jgi:Zn-dependent M28 family amino/carboxypeptidase
LTPKTLPDADSANVVAELRGRERPDEIVLLGAHLDSWDVGQGAQDDGAGVVCVMQALATLRALGLDPRRTLRAVLFTNEENGTRGGKQYAEAHRAELPHHVAAFELDAGAGAPQSFMTDGEQPFLGAAREVASLLAPLGANVAEAGFAGEDIGHLKGAGVPLFGLRSDMSHYFDVHHSAADTIDKIDPENLRKNAAALATMAYVVAEQAETWNTAPTATP